MTKNSFFKELRLGLLILFAALIFMGNFDGRSLQLTAAQATNSAQSSYDSFGDDLIPWPWGSECPFPWSEINGTYHVRRTKGGPYSGHMLDFSVEQSPKDGVSYLNIEEYDSKGYPYASGKGYSLKDKRLVRGLLTPESGAKKYSVIVRTYVKNKKARCDSDNMAVIITFCPLRGKKCLEDSNYELVKRTGSRGRH